MYPELCIWTSGRWATFAHSSGLCRSCTFNLEWSQVFLCQTQSSTFTLCTWPSRNYPNIALLRTSSLLWPHMALGHPPWTPSPGPLLGLSTVCSHLSGVSVSYLPPPVCKLHEEEDHACLRFTCVHLSCSSGQTGTQKYGRNARIPRVSICPALQDKRALRNTEGMQEFHVCPSVLLFRTNRHSEIRKECKNDMYFKGSRCPVRRILTPSDRLPTPGLL